MNNTQFRSMITIVYTLFSDVAPPVWSDLVRITDLASKLDLRTLLASAHETRVEGQTLLVKMFGLQGLEWLTVDQHGAVSGGDWLARQTLQVEVVELIDRGWLDAADQLPGKIHWVEFSEYLTIERLWEMGIPVRYLCSYDHVSRNHSLLQIVAEGWIVLVNRYGEVFTSRSPVEMVARPKEYVETDVWLVWRNAVKQALLPLD